MKLVKYICMCVDCSKQNIYIIIPGENTNNNWRYIAKIPMDNFKWVSVIKGNLIKDNENEEE